MAERIAVIGAGPAGLMAAETLAAAGLGIDVFDAMPHPGRKLLRAGIGGLNLTHSEDAEAFCRRYSDRQHELARWLAGFDATALRAWASGLGIDTFVGSSGRVFPVGMKAAPLLRAWLRRLATLGVNFHPRHRWLGWTAEGHLRFSSPAGERQLSAHAVILALGGGSWPRLGADGAWVPLLSSLGIGIAPLRPANCGFDIAWSEHLRQRYAGHPVKAVIARHGTLHRQGEFLISQNGIEGSLVYALSAPLRDAIEQQGQAVLLLDLTPGRTLEALGEELGKPRGRDSLANHLRRRAGIDGVKAALLREVASAAQLADMRQLAALIKSLPLVLRSTRPLAEAISTAGGVRFDDVDADLMLRQMPGVYCVGEMLDWEAPTGGYLLTACMASGRHAACGLLRRSSTTAETMA